MKYDSVFKNLKIVDGTGNPYYYGDIGVKDDVIIKIGQIEEAGVDNYDCTGLIAAPGFIDIHNHAEYTIMQEATALSYISQGVTSLVVGNCGETLAPINALNYELFGRPLDKTLGIKELTFEKYLNHMERIKKSINIIPLAAHGNIRSAVVGCKDVDISEDHIEDMKNLLKNAMDLGAFGFSTGLIYSPGLFATHEEIVAFAKIVKDYDGLYSTHMKNESDAVIEALSEAINIAKETGVNLEVSHLKVSGKENSGLSKTMLGMIEHYRRLGFNINGDAYPSVYCKTSLVSCLPPWTLANGVERLIEIVNDETLTSKITKELKLATMEWENLIRDAGLDDIRLCVEENSLVAHYNNKTIQEIAEELKCDPYEMIYILLRQEISIGVIAGGVSVEDNEAFLLNEAVSICSDGSVSSKELGPAHPRSYMAFTKILTYFVRDHKLMTLENAVRKMSSMPARKLGIKDRGLLLEGFKADIAIFNTKKLHCNSTFESPHVISAGMEYVIVNGKIVFKNEKATKVFSGRLLRKTGANL